MNLVERGYNHTLYQKTPTTKVLVAGENINYINPAGGWEEASYDWVPCPHPFADLQIEAAPFKSYARSQLGSDRQIRFARGGEFVDLTAMPIHYRSKGGNFKEMLPIMPNQATVDGGTLTWDSAYGMGTSLRWLVSTRGLSKWITINNADIFIDGGTGFRISTTVEIPFSMYTSLGLQTKIGQSLWDGLADSDSDEINFTNGLEDFIKMERPYYTDANGDRFYGRYRVRYSLTRAIVSASFSLTELRNAIYPLVIDPSLTIAQNTNTDTAYTTNAGYTANLGARIGHIPSIPNGGGVLRFPGVTIPSGAAIQVATLKLFIRGERSAAARPFAQVGIDDLIDATMPGDRLTFDARTKTWSAMNLWHMNEPLTSFSTSTSFHDIIEAKVKETGWISGNAVVLYIRDTAPTTEDNRVITESGSASDASLRPVLYVEYLDNLPIPAAPTTVTTTATATMANVGWSASQYASGYRVYRYELLMEGGDVLVDGSEYLYDTASVVYDGTSTSFADTGVTDGGMYQYGVEAYNATGTSDKTFGPAVKAGTGDEVPPSLVLFVKGR